MQIQSVISPQHLLDLKASGLTDETISDRGFRSVTRDEAAAALGFDPDCDSLLAIPFPPLNGEKKTPLVRFKRFADDDPKYLSPRGAGNRLYAPPRTQRAFADPDVPLLVTEGEKKSAAADQRGFPCIALIGVWGWLQRQRDANGDKIEDADSEPIPDLNLIQWHGRTVFLAFDSDVTVKREVRRALWRLRCELTRRGAAVRVVTFPPGEDGGKVGLDDYLVARGAPALRDLLDAAPPLDWTFRVNEVQEADGEARKASLRELTGDLARTGDNADRVEVKAALTGAGVLTKRDFDALMREAQRRAAARDSAPRAGDTLWGTPYMVQDGRLCWKKQTADGMSIVPLCNFDARAVEDISVDDGLESTRHFVIAGTLADGTPLPLIRVPAPQFGGMGWCAGQWGLRATIAAGAAMKDRLREAIQLNSTNAQERRVFAHLGWRRIGDRWAFLHSGGAVGAEGVEVELEGLERYRLPSAATSLQAAVKASLRLLDVGARKVTIPLLSATYRATTASVKFPDLALWLFGITGSYKSTLAALFLSHFGDFDRLHLPANFEDTENRLEKLLFRCKDVLAVVDDFAPPASFHDAQALERKAQRLIRAQGNRSGRGRLRSDTSERAAYHPRGLLLCTGEQVVGGVSVNSRMLVLEVDSAQVSLAKLAQAQGEKHLLAEAMVGFLQWLAPQLDSLSLTTDLTTLRDRARRENRHARQPEIAAHLYLGLDMFLTFACETGACEAAYADDLRAEAWETLLASLDEQAVRLENERPTLRFFSVLSELFAQGKTYLKGKDGSAPPDSKALGWREMVNISGETEPVAPSNAELLGWADGDFLYLLPDATFHRVAAFCRTEGTFFPAKPHALYQGLEREGFITPKGGRHTAVVWAEGASKRVLRVSREKLEKLLGVYPGER